MYSDEIDRLMMYHNYDIPREAYIEICKNSPQICRVKYNQFDNHFEIWTNDNKYWKFKVHNDHII